MPTFAVRGWNVVSVKNPYGHIFGFLDRSRYFFFQVAPHFTHYFSENLVATGIEPRPLICSQELWPLDHRGGHIDIIMYKIYGCRRVALNTILQKRKGDWINQFPLAYTIQAESKELRSDFREPHVFILYRQKLNMSLKGEQNDRRRPVLPINCFTFSSLDSEEYGELWCYKLLATCSWARWAASFMPRPLYIRLKESQETLQVDTGWVGSWPDMGTLRGMLHTEENVYKAS
jgi:hypothetical protein